MRYSFYAIHRDESVVEYPTVGHAEGSDVEHACQAFAVSHELTLSEITADVAWMLTTDGADIGYKVSLLQ